MKYCLHLILSLLCLFIGTQRTLAHGSVTADGDLCVIRIGFYTAHFKIYQPGSSAHRDYCEDLPTTGESVFVMEYEHQALGTVPVEFRIIRDVTGLGRFARLPDVEALGDLASHTVFHQGPTVEPLVYTVLHDFDTTGNYLGIVTARHPETAEVYSAVFPFRVGARNWGLLPLFLVLALLAHLGYWFSSGGYRRWRRRRIGRPGPRTALTAPVMLLLASLIWPDPALSAALGEVMSNKGLFRILLVSEQTPPPLNRIHSWSLTLETAAGVPVENAVVTIEGGMPEHNHGLPTQPLVSERETSGRYLVEGLRFHMQGNWELRIDVEHDGRRDTAVLPLRL